jgi:hypothetical protein
MRPRSMGTVSCGVAIEMRLMAFLEGRLFREGVYFTT